MDVVVLVVTVMETAMETTPIKKGGSGSNPIGYGSNT